MSRTSKLLLIGSMFLYGAGAQSQDQHDHAEHSAKPTKKVAEKHADHAEGDDHDEHGDEHSDDHKDDHQDEHAHSGEASDAHGEHGEEAPASVGPGKAVTEIKKDGQWLKLSPEAEKKIGLAFATYASKAGVLSVPKAVLVEFQDKAAVFRRRSDGFIELVPVTLVKREKESVVVRGVFAAQENLAFQGVPLLRAAQLEASGQGGEGHAH